MNEQVEAARRDLHDALAVARASLAQVRNRPVPVIGRELRDTDADQDVRGGNV
jgi:hypothetical protein